MNLTQQNQQPQATDKQITTLQRQLQEAQARIKELESTQNAGVNDEALHPRTANNASKIILAMTELLQWDLSKPYADDTNGEIRKVLERQGNELSKDTVGYWLKQAYNIGK